MVAEVSNANPPWSGKPARLPQRFRIHRDGWTELRRALNHGWREGLPPTVPCQRLDLLAGLHPPANQYRTKKECCFTPSAATSCSILAGYRGPSGQVAPATAAPAPCGRSQRLGDAACPRRYRYVVSTGTCPGRNAMGFILSRAWKSMRIPPRKISADVTGRRLREENEQLGLSARGEWRSARR